MDLFNTLLNLVALILWFNWRTLASAPIAGTTSAPLHWTLRRAHPTGAHAWQMLLALVGLLIVRSLIYWQVGAGLGWTARLNLHSVVISFRSDYLLRMLLFSVLSFGLWLSWLYLTLLLLCLLHRPPPPADPVQNVIQAHLRWIQRWPGWILVLLPGILGTLAAAAIFASLPQLGLAPALGSSRELWSKSGLLGIAAYLPWRNVIAALLVLHLVTTHVYLGSAPVLSSFAHATRKLLHPIRRWNLRLGRMDLSPVLLLALVFLAGEALSVFLVRWYSNL